jgi:hypothetical protein
MTRIPGLGDLRTRLQEASEGEGEVRYTLEHIAQATAAGDWVEVTEASIGRIYQHHKKAGHTSFAVVSAWRSDADRGKNIDGTNELKASLAKHGYGYNKMTGMGQEEDGRVSANEPSFFVHGMTKEHAIAHGTQFGQHSVIYGGPETGGRAHLIRTTIYPGETAKIGDHQDLGTFHAGAVSKYFSKVRGKGHRSGVDDQKTPKSTRSSKETNFTFKQGPKGTPKAKLPVGVEDDFIPVLYYGDTTNEMRWFESRVRQLQAF